MEENKKFKKVYTPAEVCHIEIPDGSHECCVPSHYFIDLMDCGRANFDTLEEAISYANEFLEYPTIIERWIKVDNKEVK